MKKEQSEQYKVIVEGMYLNNLAIARVSGKRITKKIKQQAVSGATTAGLGFAINDTLLSHFKDASISNDRKKRRGSFPEVLAYLKEHGKKLGDMSDEKINRMLKGMVK